MTITIEAIEPTVERASGHDSAAVHQIALSAFEVIESTELSTRHKWDALIRLVHAEDQLMYRNRLVETAKAENEATYRRLFGERDGTLRLRRDF